MTGMCLRRDPIGSQLDSTHLLEGIGRAAAELVSDHNWHKFRDYRTAAKLTRSPGEVFNINGGHLKSAGPPTTPAGSRGRRSGGRDFSPS